MNKFIFSALAASLVSTTGFATETDWPELDREIEALSSTLATQGGGPTLSGWVAVQWGFSGDDPYLVGGEDRSGASFNSIRLNIKGSNADYGYKVSGDLKSGTMVLRDAWGSWSFADNLTGTFGAFKAPTLGSALHSRNRQLMIMRTNIANTILGVTTGQGGLAGGRDLGFKLGGSFETVSWAIAVQNGDDNLADEYRITARASVDLMGDGAGHKLEGAYGAGDETSLSAGLFWHDDGGAVDGDADGNDEATVFGAEAYMTMGPWAAAAEMVELDEDYTGVDGESATPWDVTVSYMFNNDYEVGVRYEDADSSTDTTDITVGLNYYVKGHDVKWQLNYRTTTDDVDAAEGDLIALGLLMSF